MLKPEIPNHSRLLSRVLLYALAKAGITPIRLFRNKLWLTSHECWFPPTLKLCSNFSSECSCEPITCNLNFSFSRAQKQRQQQLPFWRASTRARTSTTRSGDSSGRYCGSARLEDISGHGGCTQPHSKELELYSWALIVRIAISSDIVPLSSSIL